MHMVLTGATITAKEAEAAGLVAFVHADDKVVEEAIKTGETNNNRTMTINSPLKPPKCPNVIAQTIASLSNPVIAMAKESVNQGERHACGEFFTGDDLFIK